MGKFQLHRNPHLRARPKRRTTIAGIAAGVLLLSSLFYECSAEDALSPPPGSNLLLETHADGVQVYVCTQTDKGLVWVFDGPSASLFNDRGRQIGVHGKGPI